MMEETPYTIQKPPKTITRVKPDNFLNIMCLHTWILLASLAVYIFCFVRIAQATETQYRVLYVFIAVLTLIIWFNHFRTDDLVQFQKDRLRFFVMGLRGKHSIDVYAEKLKTLLNIVPIVAVYDGGMIEFDSRQHGLISKIKILLRIERKRYNEYGVLIETFPPRISDEYRTIHEMRQEKIVNGLPIDRLYESISCSVKQPKREVLEYLLSLQSQSNGKASDQHLADLYLKISEDEEPIIKWRYFAFMSLGEQKTLKAAKIQYGAIIPGLLRSMKDADLNPVILPDEKHVINAYQVMLGEFDS